jgi:ankyrin repeat protein
MPCVCAVDRTPALQDGETADRTPALQDGETSLHFASMSGHAAVVQTLLQHGADVAARTKVGAAGVPLA